MISIVCMYVSVEGGLFHVNVYDEGACSPVYSTYIESLVPSLIPTFELLEGTEKIPKIYQKNTEKKTKISRG